MDDLSDVAKRVERIQILCWIFRLKGWFNDWREGPRISFLTLFKTFPEGANIYRRLDKSIRGVLGRSLGRHVDEEGRGR